MLKQITNEFYVLEYVGDNGVKTYLTYEEDYIDGVTIGYSGLGDEDVYKTESKEEMETKIKYIEEHISMIGEGVEIKKVREEIKYSYID